MPIFPTRTHLLDRTTVTPHPAAATDLLKRYRPLQTRAAGGFGKVEVCLDVRLQRRVAIKRLPLAAPDAATSDDAPTETIDAALSEARTASLLQHPNIVSVIDFMYDDAYAYLVMEYVDGMTLAEFLEAVEGHSLTYDETAAIADALVQALSFAHENGVLHLDIKPANVLIDRNGHVKLTDFGMATLISAAGFGDARGGTVGYMPPEQIIGAAVDERADIFSLATVLYESLCANAPFRAATPAASIKLIGEGVTPPSTLLPDLPESAEAALLSALSSHPDDRPASVTAFGDAFMAGLGDAREGHRSLARVIARLTSDEADDQGQDTEPDHPPIEIDPARGYLGTRNPRARRIACGVLAGMSAWIIAWPIFVAAGVTGIPALVSASLAIAIATGFAPQLGSALVGAGFLAMVLMRTDLVAVIPVATCALALIAGWWYAWGRTSPEASAVLLLGIACAALTGGPIPGMGPVAALAGYLLPPATAAASVGVGFALAQLTGAALAAGGTLPLSAALAGVADPHLLAGLVASCVAAAVTSLLGGRGWRHMQEGRGAAVWNAAIIAAGIMVVLLLCLANPMENASSPAYPFLVALGLGALSSIIVKLCTYLFGYQKDPAEVDRS